MGVLTMRALSIGAVVGLALLISLVWLVEFVGFEIADPWSQTWAGACTISGWHEANGYLAADASCGGQPLTIPTGGVLANYLGGKRNIACKKDESAFFHDVRWNCEAT